jgi:hypothetical protein
MNIIESLNTDYDQYIKHCLDSLKTPVSIIELDNSKGETDLSYLLFTEKSNKTKYEAIAILTMRLLLYKEEINNFSELKKSNIEQFSKQLFTNYENSMYFPNIEIEEFANDFLIKRVEKEANNKSIKINEEALIFSEFKKIFSFKKNILKISKTNFQRLETEYYIETKTDFILFNWFTTA